MTKRGAKPGRAEIDAVDRELWNAGLKARDRAVRAAIKRGLSDARAVDLGLFAQWKAIARRSIALGARPPKKDRKA